MTTKPKKQKLSWSPVGDRVLILPEKVKEEEETKTKHGIIVPTTSEDKKKKKLSPIGVVVAVPDILPQEPLQFEVGDTVLFSRVGADETTLDGTKYLVVPIENVLVKKRK